MRYLGRNWAAVGYLLTGGVFGIGLLWDLVATYFYVQEANMTPRYIKLREKLQRDDVRGEKRRWGSK